jgi:AraC-like DNA-binding protein
MNRRERLDRAIERYRVGDAPARVIAEELGYSSASSLRVLMHKHGVRFGRRPFLRGEWEREQERKSRPRITWEKPCP